MEDIRIESVTKTFGKVLALDEADITIHQGELFFLLGSSGCGKTTLLRCVAGLEESDSGRILFGGKDMTHVPTHKREAALVFQSYALWPHMSVGENIAFGLEERKVDPEEIEVQVDTALEMVHLPGYANRRIDELSGGQQQRVALARALVVKPACLLLDEPLSNLDAKLRVEMREEIRRIVKENGLTGIYVTHDQEEALSMADRIAVMKNGRIEQIGTPDEVYRSPVSCHVASFVGKTNLIEAKVKSYIWEQSEEEYPILRVSSHAGDFEGRLTVKDWKLKEGEKVMISVRPETFHPYHGGVPTNRLHGYIEDVTYLGCTVQYNVRGEGDQLWHVIELNPTEMRKIGDSITLSITSEDIVILRLES